MVVFLDLISLEDGRLSRIVDLTGLEEGLLSRIVAQLAGR